MQRDKNIWYYLFTLLLFASIVTIFYSTIVSGQESNGHGNGHEGFALTFFFIVILLLGAKLSSLVERFGQPAVLGELLTGVLLGNLVLLGFGFFEPIKHDIIIAFLAELGVVILLFQIGLESNIKDMAKVGLRAFLVAIVGVITPFVLGTFIVGPWLLPNERFHTYLFIGAALTATSVGITARVFKDMKYLGSPEARIVLGAAVIDDILGLIILAVVSALVTAGVVSTSQVGYIIIKAVMFLLGAIFLGEIIADKVGKWLSKINTGIGMKLTLAFCFGLLFAYLASLIGLAPIVGAFAAGLVLDAVHFRSFKNPHLIEELSENLKGISKKAKQKITSIINKHAHKHVEDLIEPISIIFVPIFFVITGMHVDLSTLVNPKIIAVAIMLTAAAFLGKLAAGLVAGPGVNKWIVGWGMVPRGEVGLIFVTIGKGLGVVSDSVFSVIVIMVILTTLIPPLVLSWLLQKAEKQKKQGDLGKGETTHADKNKKQDRKKKTSDEQNNKTSEKYQIQKRYRQKPFEQRKENEDLSPDPGSVMRKEEKKEHEQL